MSIKHKRPLLTLIIRAKKNVVRLFEAEQPEIRPVGRPRKYGDKVKLSELFDSKELFSRVECTIYGQTENVSIASLDLLWKPTKNLIRFVLAVTSHDLLIRDFFNSAPALTTKGFEIKIRQCGEFNANTAKPYLL